eukprot:scaffold1949_cov119-Cylindrotheca_fusiformis.AAC.4
MVVIKASAVKKTGMKYGIAFSRKTPESPLTVRTIRPESPFAGTGLEPEMVVTKVNGESMTWLGPRDAAKVLQKAKVGSTLTVEAATTIVAQAKKGWKKNKCGVWLKNSTRVPGVFISKINDDSIFAGSNLVCGMQVIQVNGKPCHDDCDFHDAINKLKKASGSVEIVAIDTEFNGRMMSPDAAKEKNKTFDRLRLTESSSEESAMKKPWLDQLFPTLASLG